MATNQQPKVTVRIIPPSRPQMKRPEVESKIAPYGVSFDNYPVIVVGIRGYYEDTMGVPGTNDRGIYDDAIFVLTKNKFVSFNANTDPSAFRPNIASLIPGCYFAHNLGTHKGQYLALVQRKGEVSVTRDGKAAPDKGYFGINIHKGGMNGTSSEGCQTIPPVQWAEFIALVQSELNAAVGTKNAATTTVPYILLSA